MSYDWTCRNDVTYLRTKCHNIIPKRHNATKKCHVMTSCDYDIQKKMQYQSAGYVKVKLIAGNRKLSNMIIWHSTNFQLERWLFATFPPFWVKQVKICWKNVCNCAMLCSNVTRYTLIHRLDELYINIIWLIVKFCTDCL